MRSKARRERLPDDDKSKSYFGRAYAQGVSSKNLNATYMEMLLWAYELVLAFSFSACPKGCNTGTSPLCAASLVVAGRLAQTPAAFAIRYVPAWKDETLLSWI